MSILANFFKFNIFLIEFKNFFPDLPMSTKTLFWYGLSFNIHLGYNLAFNLYYFFYTIHKIFTWLISKSVLIE